MKWKPFPDAPPVERFIRGHLYYSEYGTVASILEYIKRGMGHNGPKKYCFHRLASTVSPVNDLAKIQPSSIHSYTFKEISVEDLPLYLDFKTIHPRFEMHLQKGETHATR